MPPSVLYILSSPDPFSQAFSTLLLVLGSWPLQTASPGFLALWLPGGLHQQMKVEEKVFGVFNPPAPYGFAYLPKVIDC